MATWAKGVDFKNSGNTARVGGVGIYGTDGTVQKAYLAVGTDPWNNKGLEVTTSAMTFMGNKVYHAGAKPTPSEIGAAAASHGTHVTYSTTAPLANGTASAGSASTVARTDHVHPLQTTVSGNAGTATKLQNMRKINGTNFDGSGDITTANWGTARNITIGNTTKSVNGSGNVSWSLSEIGAAPASHSHSNYASTNHTHNSLEATDLSNKTVSLNDYNLSSGSPKVAYYICPSDGGGSNITGRPNDSTKQAFSLRVEVLRFASTTDYITKQTYIMGAQKIMYVRYCTNGTWTAWEKVYTSVQKPTASEIGAAASSHTHNYAGSSSAGGAANSAVKATQDSAGQQINTTYIKGLSVSGRTITFTKGDGTTGTITTQDSNTTYSVGTASALGLTKLYTGTGTATDGTMTQNAITTALNGKANSSHTHSYLPLSGGSVTGRLNVGGRCILPPVYNYANGILINICAAAGQTMVAIHVTGNSYGAGLPINSIYNFYDYTTDGGILSASGIHHGYNIGNMTVYRNNGRLYAWIKQPASYQTYNIEIITNGKTIDASLSDSAVHSSGNTNTITITPSVASINGHTHNYAGSSSAGGNANAAVKLATPRTINGTNFDGSANITTANWGTARNITIASSDGSGASAAVSVNGSANVALKLPATIKAALTGNATTATTLQTARTIALAGAVTGSASFNGSANITINTTENLSSNLTTITKSLNVTTSWIDTGITGTNLATGTYAVQMLVNDGTNASQYNEHYSGIMSWYADTTNSTDADEILLHKAGHASNGRHTYLRTIRSGSSGRLKLQISSTHAFTAASSITFKFKRLI